MMNDPAVMTLDSAASVLSAVRPAGFHILVRIPRLDAKMQNGLYRPDSSRSLEETASLLGEVLAVGGTAYLDEEKFPTGPWCEVGDIILMRQYSGTRLKIDGEEYRLINDDTVEAIVDQPQRVERV
jgi:co-chaperonin GroES (HSP10)